MRKVKYFKCYKKNKIHIIEFEGGNHNISDVVVKFNDCTSGILTVKYVQNGIISDLIDFDEVEVINQKEVKITVEIPVSASHIYIFLEENMNIFDVLVYSSDDTLGSVCYPAYKDIDIGANYYLDSVSVFTNPESYFRYYIYTSLNGRDFDFIASKTDGARCNPETGDVFHLNGKEARIIRVYLEYSSASAEAEFGDISFKGRKSNTKIEERPEINIPKFEDSQYNVGISEKDTINEIYGIIERRIGKEYKIWFDFSLKKNPIDNHSYDYYEIKDENGKVLISGNNGVSLATGLNYYLKYFCKVNISQVGDQVVMPENIVKVKKTIFKETKAKIRYAYNYCTLSYSMAFWGENEWRNELDWLALNGVNVILDTTAQEEVWRRFLSELSYTHEEIKKFIAGPAYYAWAYMGNMFGYGGPVHDSWFEARTTLARKNHLIMRKLGMYPVLQGYSGIIPVDIKEHDENAVVIPQGTWCSFTRPFMLKTTEPIFRQYAERFYKAQKEVYGTYSNFFATDPFHEGGNTSDMSLRNISKEILDAMLESNKNAIWIIQSWQQNPTSELLAGLNDIEDGKNHALILDLYAEKDPNYTKGGKEQYAFGYSKEFDHTPWIFCMLNNFGGRLGLHGHLDNLADRIPEIYNTCDSITGIGITPEASVNNPVLYDFIFESIWRDNADEKMEIIDLNNWLSEYSIRRYGKESDAAIKAWQILKNTVYKSEFNNIGQGAPECVLNARPSLKLNAASTWGNAIISYNKKDLEEAAKLLLKDYEMLKKSDGYIYDVVTILQQVLSNKVQDCYNEMISAFNEKNVDMFNKKSKEFLNMADKMETVTGSTSYYMLGRWVEQAKTLADKTDDFSKKIYEFNAKAIVTTWGAYNQAEIGQLHDYSNRQWSGLINNFYKPRWERWILERKAELNGENFKEKINWFEWEWEWVCQNTVYPTEPCTFDLSLIDFLS